MVTIAEDIFFGSITLLDSRDFNNIVCFVGPKWEGYFEDLSDLKKHLEKNPNKIKLVNDFLGNNSIVPPRPRSAG